MSAGIVVGSLILVFVVGVIFGAACAASDFNKARAAASLVAGQLHAAREGWKRSDRECQRLHDQLKAIQAVLDQGATKAQPTSHTGVEQQ